MQAWWISVKGCRLVRTCVCTLWVLSLIAQMGSLQARTTGEGDALLAVGGVEIRRTADGIPHLRAANWRELGVGVGYVQAQDALCTLAEAFVTYEGRRAWFFGAEARPARNSTFGQAKNLDLDFFFRAFADEVTVAKLRGGQPAELQALVDGFATGYNRYLADARRGDGKGARRACLNEAWVREIGADDVYRRMYAAQIAAGLAHFIPEIVNAAPTRSGTTDAGDEADLRARFAQSVGDQAGLGSNVLAFGGQVTAGDGAVLFGNPHWYWGGPDRFYQMHLTIPGRLDVAGVAFLGVPVIVIGFNDHIAWSHTVSTARRFGLFELMLDAADPTRYRVDGVVESMQAREVSVALRDGDGGVRQAVRTLYRTRFGPVVDLSGRDAAFGWGREHALAIRDINADNFRVFRNFFYWNQARSLDEFIAIQRREAAVPWVNTVAIGRGDPRVWYGDVGAMPNVPDTLREACATPLSKGFADVDALTPFLDASRSSCDWRVDVTAAQPGALPASAQPALLREDYVANMNDSYWLSNVNAPLEGFPAALGGERKGLSLRSRLGHRIAQELTAGKPGSAEELAQRLMHAVLAPRAYSAELFKDELLAQACAHPLVELAVNGPGAADQGRKVKVGSVVRKVDVGPACAVLQRWSGNADANDRGALLWEAFWAHLEKIPAEAFYRVAFSSEAPLETPRKPAAGDGRAAQALAAAVVSAADQGWALDAPLGSRRFVESGGQRLPLYGGCHSNGYFTVACSRGDDGRMGPNALANSYLQVVRFGPAGVVAHTLLAHGQDELAVDNGPGTAPVARYARKDWLRFPFREEEIARDPGLQRFLLRP